MFRTFIPTLCLALGIAPALADGVSAPIAIGPIGNSNAAITYPPGGTCSGLTADATGTTPAHNDAANSLGIPVTLTQSSGILYIGTENNASGTVSVTSITGLAGATKRGSIAGANANVVELWEIPYSAPFSGTITVNWSASGFVTIAAIGAGCATAFDTGGPQSNTGVTGPTLTAASSPDFAVFASTLGGGGTDTAGAGWTTIAGTSPTGQYLLMAYQIASSASYMATSTGGIISGTVIDAAHH